MPPVTTRAPLATASATWRSIFSIARALIIGPICESGSLAGPAQRRDARDQLPDERVVHAVLHVDAVGAHAGLPTVAELRRHECNLDRGVEVA